MADRQPVTEKVGYGQVMVRPVEYARALRNPLMGFRGRSGHEWATVVKHYVKWNEIEDDSLHHEAGQ